MKNIMVDLETLGNGPKAVIVSIGAVQFDETGLGDTFYINVDPESCVATGMEMDVSTVMWWMQQSDAARKALTQTAQFSIAAALDQFRRYLPSGDVVLWGNGATFDNVILASAHRLVGVKRPWSFRNDRCFRTLKDLYPQVKPGMPVGTAHNALDDAVFQAEHASRILRHIKEAQYAQVI